MFFPKCTFFITFFFHGSMYRIAVSMYVSYRIACMYRIVLCMCRIAVCMYRIAVSHVCIVSIVSDAIAKNGKE